MVNVFKKWIVLGCFFVTWPLMAAESLIQLQKAPIDPTDLASLQRGARTYVNTCYGCHALKFMRYNSLAKGIGITDESGEVLADVVKANLLFVGDKITDPMNTAMPKDQSAGWFGIAPPDLSLVTRSRGVDWVYTYMKTFYADPEKTWGVNNLVFPDVGMPHVLVGLQGVQKPVYQGEQVVGLELVEQGTLSEEEYNATITDLVNFLAYVGEPIKLERERLGVWVLLFLGVLLVFSYLLKREYWKDVH